jgi:hypothetical protein
LSRKIGENGEIGGFKSQDASFFALTGTRKGHALSPVTSKPASRDRIKTSQSEVLYSYQVS